jgi:hypothetical protein
MSAATCPTCFAPIAANVRFCSNCGQIMTQPSETEALDTTPQSAVPVMLAPQPQQAPALYYQQPPVPQQPYQQPIQAQPIYVQQPQPYQQPYQQPYPQQPQQPQHINVVVNTTATAGAQGSAPSVVLLKQKSVLVAFLLTFFFGPFGIFYVSVVGALIWIVVSIGLTLITFGSFGWLAWVISMIWGTVAASNYNKKQIIIR